MYNQGQLLSSTFGALGRGFLLIGEMTWILDESGEAV